MPGIKKGKVFSVGFSPNEICVLEFLKNKPASVAATDAGFFMKISQNRPNHQTGCGWPY
jgi:hypothetical protein